MTQEQADYGRLYDSPLFPKLFPNFEEHQKAAAEKLWKRVFARCGVDPGMPRINAIVDLGCGSGILTTWIVKYSADADKDAAPRDRKNIQSIGIDCSALAITKAKEYRDKFGVQCEFHDTKQPLPDLFLWLTSCLREKGSTWATTALVSLNHTWFHFNQTEILDAVNTHRPALLLVDVFDSWDRVIRQVRSGELVLEEGRPGTTQGEYYYLKTVRSKEDHRMIHRGIWRVDDSGGDWMLKEFGFPTKQHHLLTKRLFGKALEFNSETDDPGWILERARGQGLLTGDVRGCDYILRKQVFHDGGWGRMQCYALVPRDQLAQSLNQSYFDTIYPIVRELFFDRDTEDEGKQPFPHLRKLLALFNDDKWMRHTGFPGSREAMIVLPFDPITTFGRMVKLFSKADDTEIQKHDLIFECANQVQQRFPTASGGFHSMEDRVSSPQAFPLNWATDYDHAAADWAFDALETTLLGLRKPGDSENDKSFLKNQPLGYFFVPVYFGSMPLFALILKFPNVFDVAATDFQVYLSSLTNLLAAIKVELTMDRIELEVIRPWLAKTLENPVGKDEPGDPVKNHLDQVEKMLFGRPKHPSLANDANLAKQERAGGVINKEWKSWLLGIPSYAIKNLHSVIAENQRLWRIWQQERQHFEMDHELRLSAWFQGGKFFEGDGHNFFDEKLHVGLINDMLNRLNVKCSTTSNEPLAADALIGELMTNSIACGYFASTVNVSPAPHGVRRHYLFTWMCAKIQKLLACAEHGNAEPEKQAKKDAFLDLKHVFCKTLANKGRGIRFGVRRLYCLLEAAQNGKAPDGQNSRRDQLPALESQCSSPSDPSLHVAEFVHALVALVYPKALPKLELSWGNVAGNGLATSISVTIEVGSPVREKGDMSEAVVETFEKIRHFEEEPKDGPFRQSFKFVLDCKINAQGELRFDREKPCQTTT